MLQERPVSLCVFLLPAAHELEEAVALLLENVERRFVGEVVAVVGVGLERHAFDGRHVDELLLLRW